MEKNHEQLVFMTIPKLSDYLRINPYQVIKPKELYSYKFHNTVGFFIYIIKEKDVLHKQTEENLDRLIISLEKALE